MNWKTTACSLAALAGLSLPPTAHACKMKTTEPLRIGCTVKCGEEMVSRLKEAAEAGGYKIEVTEIPANGADPAAALVGLDAVLSPGGHDIHPKYFSAALSEKEKAKLLALHEKFGNSDGAKPAHDERDRHEHSLMKAYFTDPRFARLPLLGVCYGMQMIAAANDAPLIVDLTAQRQLKALRGVEHAIQFGEGKRGRLAALGGEFHGYKNHHQAVDGDFLRSNKGAREKLAVKATSHGGLIVEIIESKTRPAVGVQFHPEAKQVTHPQVPRVVFGWLLKAACRHRQSGEE